MKKLIVALVAVFMLAASAAYADYKVTLNWDPNPEPDLAGYRVYYKIVNPGEVGEPPYDGKGAIGGDSPISLQILDPSGTTVPYIKNDPVVEYVMEFLEANFPSDQEVYFVVTAYDVESPPLESGYSNEVSIILPYDTYKGKPPSTPGGLVPTEVEQIIKIVKVERTIIRYTNK